MSEPLASQFILAKIVVQNDCSPTEKATLGGTAGFAERDRFRVPRNCDLNHISAGVVIVITDEIDLLTYDPPRSRSLPHKW